MELESSPLAPKNHNPVFKNHNHLTINLSDITFDEHDISLLERGLSFIPTPTRVGQDVLTVSKNRISRQIKLNYFFKDSNKQKPINKFKEKSTWEPPTDKLPPEALELNAKLTQLTKEILNKFSRRTLNNYDFFNLKEKSNLSREEMNSITKLQHNSDIIIKPADKGGATVIMNKSKYIAEAYRQLNDKKYYKKIPTPIFLHTKTTITRILEKMKDSKTIDKATFNFLNGPVTPRARIFYLLPKIHKVKETWPDRHMPQGRPIISDVNSESYRISKFIDSFLSPLTKNHPSYIKNTYDFINKVRGVEVLPSDFIITADISSLYTNINLQRTYKDVCNVFRNNKVIGRPDAYLLELLKLTLHNNDFNFNNETFHQICGVPMGKAYAPSLANLYLVQFDFAAMNQFRIKPKLFFRFLDDIFCIMAGTEQDILDYQLFINDLIPDIILQLQYSLTHNNFLDTTVFKHTILNKNTLETKVFFKETDTHQLLHVDSFHPKHTFRGIIKSQLIRFKRISSFKSDYVDTCYTLFQTLKTRGYSFTMLKRQMFLIWYTYLEPIIAQNSTRLFPIIYPHNQIGKILASSVATLIRADPVIGQFRILKAFTNPPNLKQKLVHNTLDPSTPPTDPIGFFTCLALRCLACKLHCHNAFCFYSTIVGSRHTITQNMKCSSTNLIYLITCKRCRIQYVGETSRSLRDRLADHRSNIATHKNTPIALHYNSFNHTINDLSAIAIELIPQDPLPRSLRRRREQIWQKLLRTKFPDGLNEAPVM